MSKIVNQEQPGVTTTVSAAVKIQVYIIVRSRDYDELCEQVNDENVTVLTPPKHGVNVSRRPSDGEIIIDLREKEEDTEPDFVAAP